MMEKILFEADAIKSYGDSKFLVRRARLVKEVEEVVRMVEKVK
jgi:biotin synthase-like enzyme